MTRLFYFFFLCRKLETKKSFFTISSSSALSWFKCVRGFDDCNTWVRGLVIVLTGHVTAVVVQICLSDTDEQYFWSSDSDHAAWLCVPQPARVTREILVSQKKQSGIDMFGHWLSNQEWKEIFEAQIVDMRT